MSLSVCTCNCCCSLSKRLFSSFDITFEMGEKKRNISILCQELRLVCCDEICVCLLLGPRKIDHVLNIFLFLPFEARGK